MRRKNFFIIFIILVFSLKGMAGTLPDFELKNIYNRIVSLEEIKGENLTVIDFWATWCKPCLKSIPELSKIHGEFVNEGVNMVGISIDSPRNSAKVKPFSISLGIDYPVLLDVNSEVMSLANVTSVPTLLIINADNDILYIHEGFKPGDEELIRQEIRKLLNDKE